MSKEAPAENLPPLIKKSVDGTPETGSMADLLEWFLQFDEKTSRVRHLYTEELFTWKQADDLSCGIAIYPFENAEARFAIGVFQALEANKSEPELKLWISQLLESLSEAREFKQELTETYKLDANPEALALEKAERLTTNTEKRLYLTSCWREILCTAEARFLGWVYQDLYGRPFAP